jgi:hypothetical protein
LIAYEKKFPWQELKKYTASIGKGRVAAQWLGMFFVEGA